MPADDWILITDAPARVDRKKRTIYRWVAEGRIRTIRPGRKLWLHVGDLLRAERDTLGQGLRKGGTHGTMNVEDG